MHFRLMIFVVAAFSMGLVANPALAEDSNEEGGAELMTLETFQERRAEIEENFGDGGAYMEITRANRRKVESSLEAMERLMTTYGGVEGMGHNSRLSLFNEQETVNEILTAAARDSRLRCERRGRVGTRFKTTVCETYAERQRRREDQRAMYQGRLSFEMPIPDVR